jgi:hypothetical protein
MMSVDYPIRSDAGDRICDCHHDENGNITLKGVKGSSIAIQNFMDQVYNPSRALKNRGKRK